MLRGEIRRGLGIDSDHRGHAGRADVLQDGELQARQVDAECDLLSGFDAVWVHRGHDGVGDARLDAQVHDHFGEVAAVGCVGRCAAVGGEFDVATRDRIECEAAEFVGDDDLVFQAENEQGRSGDGVEIHVVGGHQDPIGADAHVVERARFQVRSGVGQDAGQ